MYKLFKFLILLIISSITLFSIEPIVTSYADKRVVLPKEKVEVVLNVLANRDAKIYFNHIEDIAGYKVDYGQPTVVFDRIDTGNKIEETIEKKKIYIIRPEKDLVVPPFIVKIDDKEYKTKPIKITIIKDETANNLDIKPIPKEINVVKKQIDNSVAPKLENIVLKIDTNKKNLIEGEAFIATVILKVPLELSHMVDLIAMPSFKGSIIRYKKETKKRDSKYDIYITKYFLTAKSKGSFEFFTMVKPENKLPKIRSMFGFFGDNDQDKVLKSNKIKISVHSKPKDVDLIGEYKISYHLNKLKTSINKKITYSVTISGFGDVGVLDRNKLKFKNSFDEKEKIQYLIKNNKAFSIYKKEYIFISDKSFTIPSINLLSFNPKTRKITKLSLASKDITIISKSKITNLLSAKESNKTSLITQPKDKILPLPQTQKFVDSQNKKQIDKEELVFDTNYYKEKIKELNSPYKTVISYILGLISGVLIAIFLPKLINFLKVKDEKSDLYGSYNEALNILYPHTTKSIEIEEMVKELYEVTNGNKEIIIDNNKLDRLVRKVLKD